MIHYLNLHSSIWDQAILIFYLELFAVDNGDDFVAL